MYDVIVVGARAAGAPTAMLLAKKGYKVLMVDRSPYGSDVLHSTLLTHLPGVALLKKWGVLDKLMATGCPPIKDWYAHFGPLEFKGKPTPMADDPSLFSLAPRRYALDKILVDAAVDAGVEFRDDYVVDDLMRDGDRVVGIRGGRGSAVANSVDVVIGGSHDVENARLVIGADGIRSMVATKVNAPSYNERAIRVGCAWTYWDKLQAMDDYQFVFHFTVGRSVWLWPTHNGHVLAGVCWLADQHDEMTKNLEKSYIEAYEMLAPELAERVRSSRRVSGYMAGILPKSFFRKPYGDGWALVGDAGACYEYTTGQGITNALRQAELMADAVDDGLSGRVSMPKAMANFEKQRNDAEDEYCDFTYNEATLQQPPPEAFPVYEAVSKNQKATDDFFGIYAQTVSPREFFSPGHVQTLLKGQS